MGADDDRRRFAAFLATQPMTSGITAEQVALAQSRDELGITSLNMIMLLLNYIHESANDSVTLRPEWVSRLGDVDGIISVLHEIDAAAQDTAATDAASTDAAGTDTATMGLAEPART
jgi:hypothetical protein